MKKPNEGLFRHFFEENLEKTGKMLEALKTGKDAWNWTKERLALGLLLGITIVLAAHYLAIGEAVAITAFVIAIPLPLSLSHALLSYQIEARKREMEVFAPDILLYASTLPKGTPLQGIIRHAAESGYGALSEEFEKTGEEIRKGLTPQEALFRMGERSNSLAIKRAASLLSEAYVSGADMGSAFKSAAEDLSETHAIMRERQSAMIIEKYTILLSAGILIPAILGMAAKAASGFDTRLLAELEMGLSAEARQGIISSAMTATPIYLAEYALLASGFVAFQEGKQKKAVIYALALLPLAIAVYFIVKGN